MWRIVQHNGNAPPLLTLSSLQSHCRTGLWLRCVKIFHGAVETKLKYPWQQPVLAAFMELRRELLPSKINAAERAISARLCDQQPLDLAEQSALQAALRALRILLPEQTGSTEKAAKKEIA